MKDDYDRFHDHIKSSNIPELILMLENGFEINKNYYTINRKVRPRILFLAIRDGSEEVLELLLKHGGNPNFWDDPSLGEVFFNYSILESALMMDRYNHINLLMEFGVNSEFIRDEEVKKKYHENYNVKPAKR
jgi:hypothetical protein